MFTFDFFMWKDWSNVKPLFYISGADVGFQLLYRRTIVSVVIFSIIMFMYLDMFKGNFFIYIISLV